MPHHLDWELARRDPRLDTSDVYIFRGSMGAVRMMDVDPISGHHKAHSRG